MLVEIEELKNGGDQRGASFTVGAAAIEFIEVVRDIHAATILPGHTRGNHFHEIKREVILVTGGSAWTFYWDEGEGCAVQYRRFTGNDAVVIRIRPGASHAIVNSGTGVLSFIGLSDHPYCVGKPDIVARRVTPAN